MTIEKATCADLDCLERLYEELNDYLAAHVNYPGWQKGWYPVRWCAEEGIAENTLYVSRLDGRIAGTMILNQKRDPAYGQVTWAVTPPVLVVHTLAVHPDFLGQGIGRTLMEFAIDCAKQQGLPAIHLDTYEKNIPAQRLYERLGFQFRGKVDLGFAELGREWYDAYELVL